MRRRRAPTGRVWLAISLLPGLVAAGCTEEEPTCDIVEIFGPETGDERESLEAAFAPLEERTFQDGTCLTVEVTGDPSFETTIAEKIESGNPPDVVMFPQPGYVNDFADRIVPLPEGLVATVEENFDPPWTDFVANGDGEPVAVPVKADLKSVVWYSPAHFEENGYQVPETQDDFFALAVRMAGEGNPPFCLGLEKGASTGWPFTDWVEDFLMRNLPGTMDDRLATYDAWAAHEIPFDHPDVVTVAEQVFTQLSLDGFVLDGLEDSVSRSYIEAGWPVLDGECMTYRMANFYAATWPEDTVIGEDVNFFHLPGPPEEPDLTLSGGIYATAFADDPLTMATMDYLASDEFAGLRTGDDIGGFLSPNNDLDPSQYANEVDQQFAEILAQATEAGAVRFDASDQMPGAVGAGTFWEAAVDIVRGTQTVDEAFAEVERNWPP
jgi:alpha-glucoside transport system substrate-binding protein